MPPIDLNLLLLQFSNADSRRLFSFSSGHVGALPIQGQELERILRPSLSANRTLLRQLLLKALGKAALASILPTRHIGLLARTLLRKLKGRHAANAVQALSVYSLGTSPAARDAYFGKLLEQINQPFNYITIAGGSLTKTPNCHLVETLLSARQVAYLCLTLPIQVPILLCQLLACTLRIKGSCERQAFLLFGLREIISGGVLTQQIAVRAMTRHLAQGHARTLLFPMEGRNWEKRIVEAAKAAQVHAIGYLHCALTPRHLSLMDNRFIRPPERPQRLIAPSEMAYNLLKKAYGDSVRKGYFLRGKRSDSKTSAQAGRDLLFALIGDIAESELIIRQAAALAGLVQHRLVIRLNPNTASFSYLGKLVHSLGLALYDPQDNALPQICFFRSSSVAIEYLKQNVRSIYLALDEPVSNNIFDLDNKFGVESISVGDIFGDNVRRLANQASSIEGGVIATYYLDENFTAHDLSRLIL